MSRSCILSGCALDHRTIAADRVFLAVGVQSDGFQKAELRHVRNLRMRLNKYVSKRVCALIVVAFRVMLSTGADAIENDQDYAFHFLHALPS